MAHVHRIGAKSFVFADLKDLMAKATPPRSGDMLYSRFGNALGNISLIRGNGNHETDPQSLHNGTISD